MTPTASGSSYHKELMGGERRQKEEGPLIKMDVA